MKNYKVKDKIGQKNIARNGMEMTIVGYRNSHDIDVQFQDGTIVYNKHYKNFKDGFVAHPSKKNKVGETSMSSIGMKMTVINYHDCNNIDIRFEDGTLVYGKTYGSFKNGSIRHPDISPYKSNNFCDHTGETAIANNGMKMTIIGYREYNDIDIQFEDGTVVYNRSYQEFNIGKISYPKSKSRIGETRVAKNGMKMTIINYRNANNIDIRFEDDVVVYNKKYENFKSGKISHPTIHYKVGERGISKNGMDITIIAYRNRNDIDIKFEDNTIVCHKSYESFKNGIISHPFIHFRVGETSTIKNGMVITIIAYRNHNDIDIKFEDGTILYNKNYSDFKNGNITYPSKYNRLNETVVAKNGMKMTIITYRNYNDIDVQFEDGTIVYHKQYCSFLRGSIGYPDFHSVSKIGKTNIAKCGIQMTIIAYRNFKDIDIRFEDGIIVKNQTYSNFKNGYIKHPSRNKTGEIGVAKNGMSITIINYRNCNDIDVQFEDGAIIYNKSYRHFKDGILVHPSKFN